MIVEISDNEADGIANSLVMNTDFMRKIKNSIAFRLGDDIKKNTFMDAEDMKVVHEKNEEVMVLQREVSSLQKQVSLLHEDVKFEIKGGLLLELKKQMSNMIRPIIIEELPNALDLLFSEEEQ
tara:strand:+ start:192 stop:560 length:369 start_codon:yes stop_codon:yes gene_type:complete